MLRRAASLTENFLTSHTEVAARCETEAFKYAQLVWKIRGVGGCLAVMAQWQSTGGSSQRCPGFDSR